MNILKNYKFSFILIFAMILGAVIGGSIWRKGSYSSAYSRCVFKSALLLCCTYDICFISVFYIKYGKYK